MSSTDSFRAFFAAPLAPPAAAALERAAGPVCALPGAGWRVTPARLLHVTLRFLGDVPGDLRPALAGALRTAAAGAAPFPASFGGWHLLPGPPGQRDPRVLAVGVSDPSGTLPRLAAALEAAARALGFPPENRPFLSHVTVARRKPAGRAERSRRGPRGLRGGNPVHPPASGFLAGTAAGPSASEAARGETLGSQEMDRITLVRSTLRPEGPVYEILEEARLGSSP